jgi:protein MpaA
MPRTSRRAALAVAAAAPLLAVGAGAVPAVAATEPAAGRVGDQVRRWSTVYGRTVRGVPLVAYHYSHTDDAHPVTRPVLALGCIHGNEQAGIAILRSLYTSRTPPPLGVEYVFLFHPNADGERRDTRQNAHLVDLNRNFPADWRDRGVPGDLTWSGPSALSEPETAAVVPLIEAIRPTIVLSYHQPLDYLGSIGGNQEFAHRFAAQVRQRYLSSSKPDGTGQVYTGTLSEWVYATYPDTLMMTTELPRPVSPALRRRHRQAIVALARDYRPLPTAASTDVTSTAPSIGE